MFDSREAHQFNKGSSMDINQAAVFLAGSLLIGLGVGFIGVVVVFLNNIFSKYWKPIQWTMPYGLDQPIRFADKTELIDKSKEPK